MDYKIDTIDRDFGTVSVDRDGTHVDLGLAVVKAGWAKVRCTIAKRSHVRANIVTSGQSRLSACSEARVHPRLMAFG